MIFSGTRDVTSGVITMTAPYTQAVYAEMVSGDGLSRAAGKPTTHRAVTGMEMTVRAVLMIETDNHHRLQMFFHPAAGAETLGAEYVYDRA